MATETPEQPGGASSAPDGPSSPKPAESPSAMLATGPLWGLLLALLGGGLAWGVHHACEPVFRLPEEYIFDMGPPPELVEEVAAAERMVDLGNRLFAGVLIGAILGIVFGVGEGVARRSVPRAMLYGLGFGLIAALFGCLAGLGGHFTYLARAAVEQRLSLTSTVIMQCVLWATLGAGVGLTFGAVAGRWQKAVGGLVAGLSGGALGGLLYPILVAFLFPSAQPQFVVPLESVVQLIWIACPVALIGLMVPFAVGQKPRS